MVENSCCKRWSERTRTADTTDVVLGNSLEVEETVTSSLIPVELRRGLVRLLLSRVELGLSSEFEVTVIGGATNQSSHPEKSEHGLEQNKIRDQELTSIRTDRC